MCVRAFDSVIIRLSSLCIATLVVPFRPIGRTLLNLVLTSVISFVIRLVIQ